MLRLLRAPRLRSLALLVQALALVCQLVEGTGREHCPHHDLPTAAVAMAHMAGHEHQQPGGQGHSCRCLSDCAIGHAALPAPDVAGLPQVAASSERVAATPHPALRTASPHRFPPSLGPPLSA